MPRLPIDLRNRRHRIALAVGLPLALAMLYWFALVGFSNPASRLRDDLRSHARRALISRVPLTFTHRPITQWTFPMRNFSVSLQRNGKIRIGREGKAESQYVADVRDPAEIAGQFEFDNIGSAIEIELIPAGDRAEVASVRPVD